jgi:hypothetical protein
MKTHFYFSLRHVVPEVRKVYEKRKILCRNLTKTYIYRATSFNTEHYIISQNRSCSVRIKCIISWTKMRVF